jgi:hypothetical protein
MNKVLNAADPGHIIAVIEKPETATTSGIDHVSSEERTQPPESAGQ